MFTRINLVVNVDTGELVYVTTDLHRPWVVGMTPDPQIEARLQALEEELAPTLGQVIGSGAFPIPRSDSCGMETGRTCESLIGNVLTDAMRTSYNTDFALTNSGGIRAALTCPPDGGDFCPTGQGSNVITVGQVLSVLPFGNVAVTVDITGAELKEMLEVGVSQMPEASGAFPQVSGLCFAYDISREVGDRVTGAVRQAADGSCTGEAIDFSETATYSLTTNDFTASGGDGYPNLLSRANSRDVLANVLVDAISETSALALPGEALSPRIQGRITCEGEGCPAPLP
jgi:2',3'-cyclic-nucleotide 2'-phosphodiesterase (5'-nucleotidase family)